MLTYRSLPHRTVSPGLVLAGLLLMLLALVPEDSLAQGKIAGRVTDAVTGEPLIGVNVLIQGTQQGTVTDADGNYIIVNVRPGEYTLQFSYIGFQSQIVEGIRVATGQTTRYDLEMREEIVEGQEIVVQAERPLVQKDLTASKKTVVAEEIEQLPVESFFGVLTTQAGVTTGAGGEIHIRGGRSNEVAYLVDGMSVGNPFNTNGLATGVAADAIQEMTVISGAFNAEYGKAMSGIVNLVTKEGGDRLEGSFSVYGGDRVTAHDEIFGKPEGLALNTYTLEGNLSGPLPFLRNTSFFLSGRYDEDNGYIYGTRLHLPSDSANFNTTPWYYEIHGEPWWEYVSADETVTLPDGSTRPGGGRPLPDETVAMNPSHSYNLLGKITMRPFAGAKIEYAHLRDGGKRTPFNFAYRMNPDGVASTRDWSYNHSLHWTHTLDPRTFYTLRLSYARNSAETYLYEDPLDPRYVSDGKILGFPGSNFLFGGNQKGHVYEKSRSIRTKLDVTKQIGIIHEAKAGVELNFHSLYRRNFVVLYDGNTYRQPTVLPPDQSPSHDLYEDQPVFEMSAYAQDKLEFDDFIINAGVRYERFDPNGRYIPDLLELDQYVALGPDDQPLERPEAKITNVVMPRLGVSFPITERGIIHFSYGHFTQMPPLRNMYVNPEFEFPKGSTPTFGNANLRPERTVQYEMGLQQQLTDQLAFDVTGFYKDIRDYLAPQTVRYTTIAGQDTYVIYLNKDYANVKGVTFALTKRRGRNGLLSATVDYTFQIAEGNNTDANAFFFNFLSGRENELEVVPLDFDQRHILSSTVTLSRPGNWGISFIGQYATGYPYTPQIIDQNIDLLPNSDRKPPQLKLDTQLYKTFSLGDRARVQAFARVFNLLDRLNERFVFNTTGRATYSLDEQLNVHAAWRPYYGFPGISTLEEYNTRPHWYSPPREVRVGVTVSF
ncbi:TonB-dependent receptor [Rhodothermaceae bacterium RA]|nr:TonB-dependent receptor [Rhodothermaceae bacterium RA]